MNWTGGARSRVQKKLKQKAQQEFFKKQRLQSTLEARNNPQWPEVRGSKDLQRLDMYSRHIAPTPTALDNKVSNLACSEYSQDGPEWLQVSCEESQGTITIPQYGSDDDGLIAGVDFPEDNPPETPLLYRHNHANVLRNGQPVTMDPLFPWPANVEPNEEPMPVSPVDLRIQYLHGTGVMELRDMDSFYKSAWVLQLQHAHHQLYMEEIKAQVLYEPPDRFSIMSAFEDVDDHFAGRKSRRSSLRYKTLDDELQVLSPGDSPTSQGVMKDARTRQCPTPGRVHLGEPTRCSSHGKLSVKNRTSKAAPAAQSQEVEVKDGL
ncbi:hypothetical protein HPB52_005346 [Rhipicephalus sanguineus]|uniref:Uncharacterized protein n=1 Tax=Rhipicephalus sanguineus TaxID=34632 RepID=A0A9D4T759_RHISA|nr:hypothetical protein HPB52_005346 [Rhipicephalus sanguineus]